MTITENTSVGFVPTQRHNNGSVIIEQPTPEQTAANLEFLLRTQIPWQYAAAVRMAQGHKAYGRRPTNARIASAHYDAVVLGMQQTVQALFGYFYASHAASLLDQAVEAIHG